MATIYECDRCGNTKRNDSTFLEKVFIPKPDNNNQYRQERNINICNRCITDLNKWADKIPEKPSDREME